MILISHLDLVPRENVEKWLKYLRNEFPTIAFKASTQTQKHNLVSSISQYNILYYSYIIIVS